MACVDDRPGRSTAARPELTVLILAGGRSVRMGVDKVWLKYGDLPLVEHVARRLLPMAGEILFSTNSPARFSDVITRLGTPARTVADLYPDAGPLAGLHAGLRAATYDLVFAVGADMPFLNVELVRGLVEMAEGYDVVVPVTKRTSNPPGGNEAEWMEPLHAVYRRTCLPAIEAILAAGRRQIMSVYGQLRVRRVMPDEIAAFDPEFRSFVNLNTPDEWARLAGA